MAKRSRRENETEAREISPEERQHQSSEKEPPSPKADLPASNPAEERKGRVVYSCHLDGRDIEIRQDSQGNSTVYGMAQEPFPVSDPKMYRAVLEARGA